jgi:hypothetical protein
VLVNAASPQVAAAALRGWALLASTLPGLRLSAPFLEASLGGLSKGLYSSVVEVREAAGEAIALLYEAAGLAELEDADSGAGALCCWVLDAHARAHPIRRTVMSEAELEGQEVGSWVCGLEACTCHCWSALLLQCSASSGTTCMECQTLPVSMGC